MCSNASTAKTVEVFLVKMAEFTVEKWHDVSKLF